MQATAEKVTRRALAKERRRQQLIDATIKSISRKGIGGTTLSDVATLAGLSQGIVNLHFNSKDNLFAETLRHLAEEYDEQFMRTLDETDGDAAAKLLALMAMDLNHKVCDPAKLAVWFAFWGEVKAVPVYRKICAERDEKYERYILDLAREIVRAGKYQNVDAKSVADTLSSLTDGFWLSCLIRPKSFDRAAALDNVRAYLRAVFPQHY